MKESDAREKWCPMVRYVPARPFSFMNIATHLSVAINRWLDDDDKQPNPEPARCIGSDCAMWRVTDNEYLPQPPEYTGNNPSHSAGYCGLAGPDA